MNYLKSIQFKNKFILFFIALLLIFYFKLAIAKDSFYEQVVSTYNDNQARFQSNYKGVEISGEGGVVRIKAGTFNQSSYVVHINLNGSIVNCWTTDQRSAAFLNKGQRVQFKGNIDDVIFGELIVNNCSFNSLELNRKNETIKYIKNKITTLSGVLGYSKGKHPNGKSVAYYTIKLDNPITVYGDKTDAANSWDNKNVQIIQIFDFELKDEFEKYKIGSKIKVTGTLSSQMTAWHFTEVLMEVQSSRTND